MRALYVFSLCLILISCESPATTEIEGEGELYEAMKQWQAIDAEFYTFVVSRSCECLPPQEYAVQVKDGEVKAVVFEELEHINYESRENLIESTHSIDELFELLERREKTADVYEVEFHEELGHPISIYIDPSRAMADEEIKLNISDVNILR